MATHSSVLAWRIPGTGEPGGLPSKKKKKKKICVELEALCADDWHTGAAQLVGWLVRE